MPALPLSLPRLSRPAIAVIGAAALVLTTWGGSASFDSEPAAAPGEPDQLAHAAAPDLALDGVPTGIAEQQANPAPEPDTTIPDIPEGAFDEDAAPADAEDEATPLPDEVELHTPDVVLRDSEKEVADLDLDGADHVAEVAEFQASTEVTDEDGESEEHELELMAVDTESFRPLTPDVTAQAPDVWERLEDGDVLVRHDIAHQLQLELGGRMLLRTEHGTLPVRIGALAANGAPPLAEVIVPFDVAELLGVDGTNALLVAADDDPQSMANRLDEVGEVELRRAPEKQESTSQPTKTGSVELESFTYTSRGDGTIQVHGDWAQRHIVRVDIPGMGHTRCHRAMVPQLMAALREIHEAGLYGHFDPSQFGGCYVPRHIMWNPSRGLSMHAWGLAIDFNVSTNMYGAEPQLHPGIVEIFKKWGFAWGGDWSTPDGMHFEVERFVKVD